MNSNAVSVESRVTNKQKYRNSRYREVLKYKEKVMMFVWGVDIIAMLHLAAGSPLMALIFGSLAYLSISGRNIIAGTLYIAFENKDDDAMLVLIDKVEFVINIIGMIGFITVVGMFYHGKWIESVNSKAEVIAYDNRINIYQAQLDSIYKVASKDQIETALIESEKFRIDKEGVSSQFASDAQNLILNIEINRDDKISKLEDKKQKIIVSLKAKHANQINATNQKLQLFFARKSNKESSLTIGQIIDENGNAKRSPYKGTNGKYGFMRSHARYHKKELDLIRSEFPQELTNSPSIVAIDAKIENLKAKAITEIDAVNKKQLANKTKEIAKIDAQISKADGLAVYKSRVDALIGNIQNARDEKRIARKNIDSDDEEDSLFAIPIKISNGINSIFNTNAIEPWMIYPISLTGVFLVLLVILSIMNKGMPLIKASPQEKEAIHKEKPVTSSIFDGVLLAIASVFAFIENWYKVKQMRSQQKLKQAKVDLGNIHTQKVEHKKPAVKKTTLKSKVQKAVEENIPLATNVVATPAIGFHSEPQTVKTTGNTSKSVNKRPTIGFHANPKTVSTQQDMFI